MVEKLEFLIQLDKLLRKKERMGAIEKNVGDLGAAAYLMMGEYRVKGKKNKQIAFEIEEGDHREFENKILDYLSSEFHRFDACIMSLKKIGEYVGECKTVDLIHKQVNDLGAAAYLMMMKYKILGKRGRTIYFEVDKSEQKEFENKILEYLSSDFHRFDACIMSLKKISEYDNRND